MSNEEFVIQPTNRAAIAFQGRMVARAVGSADDPKLLGRHHAITVYETNSGDLHLVFDFKTTCDGEMSHCDIELRVQPAELPDLLLIYDPSEYLNRNRLRHRHESVINQFVKRLHKEYDELCASIERQMLDYKPAVPVAATGDACEPSETHQSGWKSWLPFGKPR